MTDSQFVAHEACPNCGSSDGLARYDDGHGFCFVCRKPERGTGDAEQPERRPRVAYDLVAPGEFRDLDKRRLSADVCRKFGYTTRDGKQIAPYHDKDGRVVAQKIRTKDKEFSVAGDMKTATLFGQKLFKGGGKMLTICEGEIDAMSAFKMNGGFPVVSIPNGAAGAAKAIAANLEFVESFDRVVLAFDMDEPGQDAAQEVVKLLTPGKGCIASLPLKDANECLVAGRTKDFTSAVWEAKPYRPDGIVSVGDLIERLNKPIEWGLPWFLDSLTKLTYGRRYSEVYMLGAGTGVGKTDFLVQQIEYDINTLKEKVGVVFLEQGPEETTRRICGKECGRLFHVPGGEWTQEELMDAVHRVDKDDRVRFYDSFGACEWDVIKLNIRFMAKSEGIKIFYLDHLTAMADPSNERESLETIMRDLATLAKNLNIILHVVSHLSTPDGKPHEEGGRVMIRHFKGSRAIGFWSHFMFGMKRDQQAKKKEIRETTTFRCLKDRFTGKSTGQVLYLGYDGDTGRLSETENPLIQDDFEDEGEQDF